MQCKTIYNLQRHICCTTYYFTRHKLIIWHNYLPDINHQIKFMRHKYVTHNIQIFFHSWRTYILIYNNLIVALLQDQSGMGITTLLSCNNSSMVPPRLDHLEGSWWIFSYPAVTWLSWIIPYCVPPSGEVRRLICMYIWICAYVSTPLFSDVRPPLSGL